MLAGIATSGVVLSTLREAADKDFKITVLSDCCADRDEEVHRVLTTKVFPRQADVMTAEEWSKAISKIKILGICLPAGKKSNERINSADNNKIKNKVDQCIAYRMRPAVDINK